MASEIEPLEIKVDSAISTGIKPEISLPQDILDTDFPHENPVSNCEQITESCYSCMRDIPDRVYGFCFRFCFRILFCVVRLCLLCLLPVVYAFLVVVTVIFLPLLLAAFIVVRLYQFIGSSRNLEKQSLIKKYLCVCITMLAIGILIEIGLFYPVVKYVPRVKGIMIIGLPITKWINIICILVGIFLLSQVISFSLVFIIARQIPDNPEMNLILSEAMSEIVGCLLFWWAEIVVMSSVPTFKQSKIAGIYTNNWIKVSLFLIIGYNIITLITHALVWLLLKFYGANVSIYRGDDMGKEDFNKKYVIYITTSIKGSIISILSMMMLLITWVVYFVTPLEKTPKQEKNLEFGTWTIVSVLVCLFLWLIKSCILLYWEAHSVYERLHSKIMDTGELLYFLIMLSCTNYRKTIDIVKSPVYGREDDFDCNPLCFGTQPKSEALWVLSVNNNDDEKDLILNRKSVRAELINYPWSSIYDLQRAAQRLLTAQYALMKESDIGDNLNHFQSDDSGVYNANCIETLRKIVKVEGGEADFGEDWKMLLKLISGDTSAEEISFQNVKRFMVRAHSRCIILANTLISENEVVKCLNQVISCLIIAVTFIMWLLLTGLASTKVLVLVASPALAATFIFGDTAKTLFQGLIFVYIVHPFDVGDLCLIDEKLLEVKRIGVWSTTFSKVRTLGKQRQVIYPNSVLALKNVINHKTDFDWDDHLEFITSPDDKITEPLRQKIETYLDDRKDKFTPNFHSLEILEMGDKAKIGVHVKHKFKTTEGWTYFECLKKKDKRRLKLAIQVQRLLKQVESQAKTSEMEELKPEDDGKITQDTAAVAGQS